MASSSGEMIHTAGQTDDGGRVTFDDSREGKKKKFRPLQAMKNFFKGGKKSSKPESRTQSRSLQMINAEDSDDDGGFRRRHPMGEGRSMSEDSVFHPEVKDTKQIAMRKTAISTESLNIDFKPQPGKFNRGSDISIDTSEIDEDDLFKTDWRKSVASVSERKSSVQSLPDRVDMDLDLSAIGKDTVTLKNDAARHRISVKRNVPKRRPSGKRKSRELNPSTTSALPQVKEESPTKSEAQISPIIPEPLSTKLPSSPISPKPTKADLSPTSPKSPVTRELSSPKSPVTMEPLSPKSPVSPKLMSPKSVFPKQDLFSRHAEKAIPPAKDPVFNVPDNATKSQDLDFEKKADEHKTVISVGSDSDLKTRNESVKFKSMSLDRKDNYNLSDYSKASFDKKENVSDFSVSNDIGQIAKLSRQRPKSLHDSSLPSTKSEEDSELLRTFNKLKKTSSKETENVSDMRRDTGFVLVGSIKNKDRDIPFGARRPGSNTQSTSFNEGISAKPEATPVTTQNTSPDLVKTDQSPTKTNFTYVLKKEPLKSQNSFGKDAKPQSTVTESKLEQTKQFSSDTQLDKKDTIVDTKSADLKQAKEPDSNYENVTLTFNSILKDLETKDSVKTNKVVVIDSDDKTDKGRNSGYDNVVISSESPNKLASPREDYRLKRQSRSRTLPEQPVTAEILASANKETNRKDSLTHSFKFKGSDTIQEGTESKPLETKSRLFSSSMKATTSSTSTTPTWMQMAKKRQEEAKEAEMAKEKDIGATTGKPPIAVSKANSVLDSKDRFTPKSVFSSSSGGSADAAKDADSKNRFQSKSIYSSATKVEPPKDQPLTKAVTPASLKKTSFRGSTVQTSETTKDTKTTSAETKDTNKTENKPEEKKTAASLAKSFESKSTTPGRNVSLDTPKGWKPPSKVKIEIIEKTDTVKTEQTSKPLSTRTTTAKKTEEKSPLKNVAEKCVDKKSKVLDMVKNFQNLEVS